MMQRRIAKNKLLNEIDHDVVNQQSPNTDSKRLKYLKKYVANDLDNKKRKLFVRGYVNHSALKKKSLSVCELTKVDKTATTNRYSMPKIRSESVGRYIKNEEKKSPIPTYYDQNVFHYLNNQIQKNSNSKSNYMQIYNQNAVKFNDNIFIRKLFFFLPHLKKKISSES